MIVKVNLVGYLAVEGLPGGFHGGLVELSEGALVADLLQAIHLPLPTPNLISRGDQITSLEAPLREGDIVSLIPPIGGGSLPIV